MRALTMILAVSPAWAGTPDWLLMAKDFVAYPGYTGGIEVTGRQVAIYAMNGANIFNWNLEGVDPACASFEDTPEGGSGNPNGCGVHIHEGTTCSDASAVGGHYYDTITLAEDPWTNVSYYLKTNQLFTGNKQVVTGFDDYADLLGHAVIIHDHAGGRIACAILAAPPPVPPRFMAAPPPPPLLKKLLATTATTTTAALATAAAVSATAAAVSVVAPGLTNLANQIASQIADKLAELRPETAAPAPSFSHPSSAPSPTPAA